jgi:hypothetical protein
MKALDTDISVSFHRKDDAKMTEMTRMRAAAIGPGT